MVLDAATPAPADAGLNVDGKMLIMVMLNVCRISVQIKKLFSYEH
jgi:hypothetical protein